MGSTACTCTEAVSNTYCPAHILLKLTRAINISDVNQCGETNYQSVK